MSGPAIAVPPRFDRDLDTLYEALHDARPATAEEPVFLPVFDLFLADLRVLCNERKRRTGLVRTVELDDEFLAFLELGLEDRLHVIEAVDFKGIRDLDAVLAEDLHTVKAVVFEPVYKGTTIPDGVPFL